MRAYPKYSNSRFALDREKVQLPRSHAKVSGRRYYSPSHGRFLGRDPIQEKGGLNLYGFVANNPINAWDILGMADAGNIKIWDFGGKESDPAVVAQVNSQIAYLKDNQTQAGKIMDELLAKGYDIFLVVTRIDSGHLDSGHASRIELEKGDKQIRILYDPDYGTRWLDGTGKDAKLVALDGTDRLAHELGHAAYNVQHYEKNGTERYPHPTLSEHEAHRVQAEITYLKGQPREKQIKDRGSVPDWGRYVVPRMNRDGTGAKLSAAELWNLMQHNFSSSPSGNYGATFQSNFAGGWNTAASIWGGLGLLNGGGTKLNEVE